MSALILLKMTHVSQAHQFKFISDNLGINFEEQQVPTESFI